MANPRQRNKARSHKSHKPSANSVRRIHQKLRKAPPLKGPEVLQEAWDTKRTVFQNYAALGLLSGIPLPPKASSSRSHKASLPFLPPHLRPAADETESNAEIASTDEPKPKVGFGRIIRDEEGNVIDIIIDEEPEAEGAMEVEQGEGAGEEEGEGDGEAQVRRVEAKTDVVRSLEALAASATPVTRHSSTSERTWLSQLAKQHDDDYERMARDKRNVWQKTPGELKRMIRKAGGVEKLKTME